MAQKSLKALFTFDEQTSTFSPAAHNLTQAKATARASQMERQGYKIKILEQDSSHHGCRSFKTCQLCQTAAENLSQKSQSDTFTGDPAQDAPDAPSQNEGD